MTNEETETETGLYQLNVNTNEGAIYALPVPPTPKPRPQTEGDRPSVPAGRAAAIAGVHPDTMRAYVDQGLIDGYRLPKGHRRVYLDSLARHIAARRPQKNPPAG